MCDGGAFSVPIITALAGTAMQVKAQNDATDKQQKIAQQAEQNQNNRNQEQQNLVLNEAEKFDPAARNASLDQTAQTAEQSLGSAIAAANSSKPQADAGGTGKVSAEYSTAHAGAVADNIAKAAESARLMSRVRAPGDMLGNENMDYADMLSRVGTIGSKSKGEWGQSMNAMNAVTPNSGMMLLGDGIKAGGTAYGNYAMKK